MPPEWPEPTDIEWPDSLDPRSGTTRFVAGDSERQTYSIACHYNDSDHTEVYFHFGDADGGVAVYAGLSPNQALAIYQRLEDVLADMGVIEIMPSEDHLSDLDAFDQELIDIPVGGTTNADQHP